MGCSVVGLDEGGTVPPPTGSVGFCVRMGVGTEWTKMGMIRR